MNVVKIECAFDKMVPIQELKPHPQNANKHSTEQIRLLAKIIESSGFRNPVCVSNLSGFIIKGHARLEVAKKLGMKEVPVDYQNFASPEEELSDLLADNRIQELAELSIPDVREILKTLDSAHRDLELTGFAGDDLKRLMDGIDINQQSLDERAELIPDLPKKAITRKGNIWILGNHKLLCGDSISKEDTRRLIGKSKINLAFTSPPYAEQREYDKESEFKPIKPNNYVEWFRAISENVFNYIASDGSWFVNIKPSANELDTDLYVFDLILAHVREWGWHFATEFCWERNGVPKQVVKRFKNQFESIYQFVLGNWKMRPANVMTVSENVPIPRGKNAGPISWKNNQGFTASDKQGEPNFKWFGDQVESGFAYPGNRLPPFSSTHEALGHPAAFPVGLPEFFIKAYTDAEDNVYDPFMGSGSTLIACEKQNRNSFGMEISPLYCDLIVSRFEQFSGLKAKRIGN